MTPESQAERERFEMWHRERFPGFYGFSRTDDMYYHHRLQARWEIWRAALAAHPASEPVAFNVCATMPHGKDTAIMHRALVYSREQAEAVIKQWPEQMPRLGQCRMEIRALVYAAHPASAWVSVAERLPDEDQSVAFVVSCKNPNWDDLNGKVLGGTYRAGKFGGFTVPGLTIGASHWMPLPAAPVPGAKEGM